MQYRLLLAASLSLLLACEDWGLRQFDDAGTPPEIDAGDTPARDAGPPEMLVSYRYTPEGCDYEVRTAEVSEAGEGTDEVGAEATPTHVHVGWAGDTSTTFNVNWETGRDTTASYVIFGTDEDAVTAADDGDAADVTMQRGHHLLYANTALGVTVTGYTRIHEVHVCGLEPGTRYWYKAGAPGNWSEVYDVATAPEVGSTAPWRFAATGDSRNNQEDSWAISQKRVLDRGVDLQIFSGDAVFLGTYQNDWDTFFEAEWMDFTITDLLARVPFMMANGNHDALSVNYVSQFAFPQNESTGERAQGEEWFSFDYANAHFVMLNDSVADNSVLAGAEADWLRADLNAVDRSETPWIFVVHHRPFYTCLSTHRPDQGLRQAWQPLFDEFEVDIVFTGHNHVYERSNPIRGLEGGQGRLAASGPGGIPTFATTGTGSGSPSGTVYIVAAGVGAPLYSVSDECPTTNQAQSLRNYVIVDIEDRDLTFTVYDAMSDTQIDAFAYSK